MTSLVKISLRFEQSCNKLEQYITYALGLYATNAEVARLIISFCIIRLHDQWNARCRELILKSALGNCKTLSGQLLRRTVRIDPLQQLRKTWSSRKGMPHTWEPYWHMPAVTIRAAKLLNLSNYDTIRNAIAAITLIEELRWTRNAIAHELPRTYYSFRLYQSRKFNPPIYCPADYVIQRIAGTPDLIIDTWMNEIKTALKAAIK
jgi:hypothetical protein